MSQKRPHDALEKSSNHNGPDLEIYESSSIEDRKSVFKAIFSPSVAPRELQKHAAYKEADHRVLGWRKPSKQQSIAITTNGTPAKTLYDTGCDDDGEKYAGKKLERLLIDMNIVGSVVVARWWGGIMLGPVRFDHISNIAKEAIEKWQKANTPESTSKKAKVEIQLTPEQEEDLRIRLAKQLADRDNSIIVLRELLAEKKVAARTPDDNSATKNPVTPSSNTQRSQQDYTTTPLARLRQLEKAKDQTIAWILKQIDDIEIRGNQKMA